MKKLEVWLVPFTMFVKVDGQEGDKLCLQFISKGKNVKCLCRYCTCPTEFSGIAYRDDPRKTKTMIQGLVRRKDEEALTKMSQHTAWNAFYEL